MPPPRSSVAEPRQSEIVGAFAGIVAGLAKLADRGASDAFVPATLGVAALAALVASYKLTRATEDKIVALGRLSGMSDEQILAHVGYTTVPMRAGAPTTPTGV
jgi:hypothetical protein